MFFFRVVSAACLAKEYSNHPTSEEVQVRVDDPRQEDPLGQPFGFAKSVTGGGDAECAVPRDIHELESWLGDNVARCILLDREYDFRHAMGPEVTEMGCRPDNFCGVGGQLSLKINSWCHDQGFPDVPVTYDRIGIEQFAMKVGSHKTLRGVGKNGAIRGRGLRLLRVQNVIIQNLKIWDLNEKYIWGGDAVMLEETDLIWMDHCVLSNIGRQMFVTQNAGGRMSITHNVFNGASPCQHYWSLLFYGMNDRVTLAFNYFTSLSGRAPRAGSIPADSSVPQPDVVIHAYNNVWENCDGIAFDLDRGASVIAKNNIFIKTKAPVRMMNGARLFTSGNVLQESGSFSSSNTLVPSNILSDGSENIIEAPSMKAKGIAGLV